MRLKLTIAYDGTAFKGWQSQPFGLTVQDTIEGVLKKITGERIVVHGSGRTDTGVHALGQCAYVEVPDRFALKEWQRILNFNLPTTIRVMRCVNAPKGFHARFSAKGKIYRYLIRNDTVVLPHEIDRVWMVTEKLDATRLSQTAMMFEGRHDFRGFTTTRNTPDNTMRNITRIAVTKRGSLTTIIIHGEGFLHHMVRLIVAAIVRVAQGQDEIEIIRQRLDGPGKPELTQLAPACGLYLVKVLY